MTAHANATAYYQVCRVAFYCVAVRPFTCMVLAMQSRKKSETKKDRTLAAVDAALKAAEKKARRDVKQVRAESAVLLGSSHA